MLFLFKQYKFNEGIIKCCEKYDHLALELLIHYIKQAKHLENLRREKVRKLSTLNFWLTLHL